MSYDIIRVYEHFEVCDSFGRFLFSADSVAEAKRLLERMEENPLREIA
jgi:hypothetical protein